MHDYVIMDRENHASLYDGCQPVLRQDAALPAQRHGRPGKEAAEGAGNGRLPDRDRRRVLHGRRHCKSAGDLRVWRKQIRRARHGRRCARPRRPRRGRPRHGQLLRPRGSGRYLHGHVLQIARVARRLHGREQPRWPTMCATAPARSSSPRPSRPRTAAAALAALRMLERAPGAA